MISAPSASPRTLWSPVDRLGHAAVQPARNLGAIFRLSYLAVRVTLGAAIRERRGFRSILGVILSQVYFTGWQALPLTGAIAFALGGAIIINASAVSFIDGAQLAAKLMTVVVIRELAPLFVALILIARSGTAIASELGNMKVNHEIDALETMAINPLSYIVFPRLMGGIVSIVCLTFYFSVLALAGGFVTSQLFGDFSLPSYVDALTETLTGMDVAFFFIKSILNGAAVFAIACYYGLSVNQSPHEVPQATTRAVLSSISAVGVTTVLATLAFYFDALRGLVDL